jgi:hypothetical protein
MPDERPNILVIWGDDIGITNLSCNTDGRPLGRRVPVAAQPGARDDLGGRVISAQRIRARRCGGQRLGMDRG